MLRSGVLAWLTAQQAQDHELSKTGGDEDVADADDLGAQRDADRYDVGQPAQPGVGVGELVARVGARHDGLGAHPGPSEGVGGDGHRAVGAHDEGVGEQAEGDQTGAAHPAVAGQEAGHARGGDDQAGCVEGASDERAEDLSGEGGGDQRCVAEPGRAEQVEATSGEQADGHGDGQHDEDEDHAPSVAAVPPALPPTPIGAGVETVLVADRGSLGARVVRTVQALGARAVTIHLDGEHGHGDESVLLGGPGSDADVVKVLEAARQAGADAVHPGAGPLAAHPGFAAAVVEAGLVWVGPPPASLGGTPVLPATRREVQWLGGAAVDERDVVDDLIVSSGPPAPGAAPLAGVVSVVGDLVVPHLTLGHVVTEEALGLDLVALQLRTAAGEDVPYEVVARAAAGVVLRGTGTVERLSWPEGVRVETACREGAAVPPDGVVAVLAVAASTTALALDALRAALAQTLVEGVALVVPDLERTRA